MTPTPTDSAMTARLLTKEQRDRLRTGDTRFDPMKLIMALNTIDKMDIALQSLTPGGSEYVNDPERCVVFVRNVRTDQHNHIVRLITEKKALEARALAAEAKAAALVVELEKEKRYTRELAAIVQANDAMNILGDQTKCVGIATKGTPP